MAVLFSNGKDICDEEIQDFDHPNKLRLLTWIKNSDYQKCRLSPNQLFIPSLSKSLEIASDRLMNFNMHFPCGISVNLHKSLKQ